MRAVTRRLTPILLAALVLAACGNEKTKAPDVSTVGKPTGTAAKAYPAAGLRFAAPAGWNYDEGKAPMVGVAQTGRATVGVWRYPRTETLPRTKEELTAARDALLSAAKTRDPSFTPIKSAVTKVNEQRAVQIRGNETIDGQRRTVRSTHIYAGGAEIVIDAVAPVPEFRRVDAQFFRPMLRSLRISRPTG